MTPSQLYNQESQNGKLKAEIKQMLLDKALNRYEAEELIQLTVLNELDRPRKIYPTEIKRIKENSSMTPNEKLDTISKLYTNNGYHVTQRDRLGIQLFKKKKFSYLSAFLWFLLLGVGLVIYILYYLVRGDYKETIIVDDNYKVKPEGIVEEPIIILPNEDFDEDTELIEDEVEEDMQDLEETVEENEEEIESSQDVSQNNEESLVDSEETEENITEEVEEPSPNEEEKSDEQIDELLEEAEDSNNTTIEQEEIKKEDK